MEGTAGRTLILLLMVLIWTWTSLTLSGIAKKHHKDKHAKEGEIDEVGLKLSKQKDVVSVRGGIVRSWEGDHILRRTRLVAHETFLEQDSLLMPMYTDVHSMAYVKEGCGLLGIVNPWKGEFTRKYVRRVKAGDIFAVPAGMVVWLYNDNKYSCADQEVADPECLGRRALRVISVGETSQGFDSGRLHAFHMFAGTHGGKHDKYGAGLLHGFSHDLLGEAWDVDNSTLMQLMHNQKDIAITQTCIRVSLSSSNNDDSKREIIGLKNKNFHVEDGRRMGIIPGSLEFTFNLRSSVDLVSDAGWINMATSNKLPVLAHVGFSAMRLSLKPEAMLAPHWALAHQVFHVLNGSGTIQVVNDEGQRILDMVVQEDDTIVVPKFFPSILKASRDGIEVVKIITNHMPTEAYMAGGNSVYKLMPAEVVAAAFDIDLELECEVRKERRMEEVILQPRTRPTQRNEACLE